MTNIQEALKSVITWLEEDIEEDLLDDVNDISPAYITAKQNLINDCKATLANIEKCEPVGEVSIDYQGFMAYRRLKDLPEGYHKLYTSPQHRDWVDVSDSFVTETIWENTKLNPNIQDDAETLLYVTNAVKAILAEAKQLNTKG